MYDRSLFDVKDSILLLSVKHICGRHGLVSSCMILSFNIEDIVFWFSVKALMLVMRSCRFLYDAVVKFERQCFVIQCQSTLVGLAEIAMRSCLSLMYDTLSQCGTLLLSVKIFEAAWCYCKTFICRRLWNHAVCMAEQRIVNADYLSLPIESDYSYPSSQLHLRN